MIKKSIFLIFILLPTLIFSQNPGDLIVAPTRAVFEGRTRTIEINLVNNGTEKALYRIGFKNLRLTEEGAYEKVSEEQSADSIYASSLVRYSPRQVSLQPGERQIVRLMVRKPKDLPPGEYRSHLSFNAIPDLNKPSQEHEEGKVGIELIPIFGVSIPILVRHGNTNCEMSFENAKITENENGDDVLEFTLNRKGNASYFGKVEVVHKTADNSLGKIIAVKKGLSVLYPLQKLNIRLPFLNKDKIDLNNGKLNFSFYRDREHGEKLLAEIDLEL
ncbi:Uncharacterized protein SCG7109_AD_00120 [Chlamydiales bacterium SCGC AG-110-M15]|nr:Uncharacterized protein SCG7109_AD_00120 [Chlamydiales bacterium SCGC AG-110-M15]